MSLCLRNVARHRVVCFQEEEKKTISAPSSFITVNVADDFYFFSWFLL